MKRMRKVGVTIAALGIIWMILAAETKIATCSQEVKEEITVHMMITRTEENIEDFDKVMEKVNDRMK
ncbi:MAG: hypothetical protein MR543_03550, partial [Robinsoniella sp.]|nr:hypothetical protein [Robinsoniella sp.]